MLPVRTDPGKGRDVDDHQTAPTSGAGRFTRIPCGRRGKWIVLAIWILALIALGPLAGKLTGAQKDDMVEWLPGSAGSTHLAAMPGADGVVRRPPNVTK